VTFANPDNTGDAVLDELLDLVGVRFSRAEPRRRGAQYVRAVLSGVSRPNGWALARYAGEHHPNGMQRLLTTARWDPDGVRDDVRDWLGARIGDRETGVLVPTEVGFRKKGTGSVGAHRRYDGAAGRLSTVQVGVFLGYLSRHGWALVDRELYLPQDWLADREQARRLGVPEGLPFADRVQLAVAMVGRALDSGLPFAWVAADEPGNGYGRLRGWLDRRGIRYVIGAAWYDPVVTARGQAARVRDLGRTVPDSAWQPHAGCEWAGIRLATAAQEASGAEHILLVRRAADGQFGYYHCRAGAGTPAATLARIAGAPDTIRERVGQVRAELGLDRYQVRRYEAWYRHVTLCLAAGAYLAATRSAAT
jgi:SRSO17 transposase